MGGLDFGGKKTRPHQFSISIFLDSSHRKSYAGIHTLPALLLKKHYSLGDMAATGD